MIASWKDISRAMQPTGICMFIKIFEDRGDLLKLYNKFRECKTKEEQSTSEELDEHANKVMETLDEGIRGLDELDAFFVYLHQVGAFHTRIPGFKAEYFWSQLGLLLDNNAARIAVGLRLGSQLCEEHKCVCGGMVQKDGLHGLSCPNSGGWIYRHDDMNRTFAHAISSAGFPTILQPPGISRDDGKRPDGMTLTPWSHGKSLLWDVTVRNTLAHSYINESSKKAGSVADKAERHKHNHYISLKENHLFTPIASETLGCMGPETRIFIKKLGSLMKRASGEPRSMDYLKKKINYIKTLGPRTTK